MEKSPDSLWLDNQLCFPLYAVSRLVTKQYHPFLQEMDITYPQYLVLLVLWERGECTVSQLSEALLLETNTLTPLLKRLVTKELISRRRSEEDERKVLITVTAAGQSLQERAQCIPPAIVEQFVAEDLDLVEVQQLQQTLHKLLRALR